VLLKVETVKILGEGHRVAEVVVEALARSRVDGQRLIKQRGGFLYGKGERNSGRRGYRGGDPKGVTS
jgi:hypothetical protein